jgi:cytochrome c oxidase assembly protein subunit 11
VQFDATVASGLNVTFTPEMREIPTQLGKVITVNYTVENKSNSKVTVVASYNVSPPQAGRYFNKLQCFCFTDQVLEPFEKKELPVVYFLDPDLGTDKEFRNLREISLHYTFFPSKNVKITELQTK